MLTLPVRPELLLLPRTLTTSRLTLRCYNEGDGAAFFNAVHASRASLSQRLPWVNSNQSVEDSETYVRKMAAHWLLRTDLVFGMWHEENFVGAVGLHSIQWQIPSMMMGWFVCDPFENQGFCTEAGLAVKEFAHHHAGAIRVWASCDADNQASERVMQKMGMSLEGKHFCDGRTPQGQLRDSLFYASIRKTNQQ
jgi:RimJ/RimL family protein N-acetyltransferase